MQYQINIIDTDVNMDEVRKVCADLLHEDQTNESPLVGTGYDANCIYIDTDKATVSEAVERIDALGYSTDEDE